MTDLLDPPSTDLFADRAVERWSVEVSTSISVTGRPGAPDPEFEIVGRAEQLPLITNGGTRSAILLQMLSVIQSEYQVSVSRGVLIDHDIPYAAFEEPMAEATGPQVLNTLLADFVRSGTDLHRMAQVEIVENLVHDFPVPVFGSPPRDWTTVGNLSTSGIAGYFVGDFSGNPVLGVVGAGVTSAVAFIIWFAKPSARVARRSAAQRLAIKMGTQFRPEDES